MTYKFIIFLKTLLMKNSMNILAILVFSLSTCATVEVEKKSLSDDDFNSYWYQGEAELSSYELQQARYGELRKGTAVMIFVTEDFWKNRQVKKESKQYESNDQAVNVLKLNFLKKFSTGIYDYSLMSSIFQPVNLERFAHPLKINGTIQDWCGQVFYQMNYKKDAIHFQSRSYFEDEGDLEMTLAANYSEDQIWNLIRINPNKLPVGKIDMIPSGFYTRLMHKEVQAYKAEASILESHTEHGVNTYKISYAKLNRTMEIHYSTTFPYMIEGWSETYVSGWGTSAKELISTAKRIKTMKSPYWRKNSVKDSTLRKELLGPLSP